MGAATNAFMFGLRVSSPTTRQRAAFGQQPVPRLSLAGTLALRQSIRVLVPTEREHEPNLEAITPWQRPHRSHLAFHPLQFARTAPTKRHIAGHRHPQDMLVALASAHRRRSL